MTPTQALFLGVLQGLTEFLPVSSDGHLALAEMVLGLRVPAKDLLAFDILLHAASLLALLLCYARTWWRMARSLVVNEPGGRKLLLLLAAATVPGAIAGAFLEEVVASLRTPIFLGSAFGFMGFFLIASEWAVPSRRRKGMGLTGALLVGVAQAFALAPALSRSGLTIGTGRLLGLGRREALDFSFLMAVPIIAGATLFTMRHLLTSELAVPPWETMLPGLLGSLASSVLAIVFLWRWVGTHSLAWFSLYLFPLSLLLLIQSV